MTLATSARRFAPEWASALAAIACAAYVAGSAARGGFPVDDAWIHMVYGLSLARGGGLSYDDGVAATGATSPLWAFVAALAHLVTFARGPSMAAAFALKLLGVSAHATTSALGARCARLASPRAELAPFIAIAAGLLIATSPVLAFAAVSGMEVSLASALLFAALLSASRGRAVATGVTLGLAFLARPESAIVAPIAVLVLAIAAASNRAGSRRASTASASIASAIAAASIASAIAAASIASAIATAMGAALLARNLAVSGRPLPATFYMKAAPPIGRIMIEIRMERGFGDVLGALAPTSSRVLWWLVVVALVAIVRRGSLAARAALLGAGIALSGLAYAAAASWMVRVMSPDSFYFQRYFAPSIPLFIVAAASGAASLVALAAEIAPSLRAGTRHRALTAGVSLAGLVAVAAQMSDLPAWAARYRADVADIDAVQVAMGHFLAQTVPEGAIVWSMDAGAPRYWSQRRVVDLGKLNTPDLFTGADVRAGFEADTIVTLDHAIRVVASEGALERVYRVRYPSLPPPPAGPEFTQTAWRCLVDGAKVEILGYPDARVGRCKAR